MESSTRAQGTDNIEQGTRQRLFSGDDQHIADPTPSSPPVLSGQAPIPTIDDDAHQRKPSSPPPPTSQSSLSSSETEEFPVFDDSDDEEDVVPPPPPPPIRRRRGRLVTEVDLRILRSTANRRVFNYVDLVSALRRPPPANFQSRWPPRQPGINRPVLPSIPSALQQSRPLSPPPWLRQ